MVRELVQDELIEYWTLNVDGPGRVADKRGAAKLGFALVLKFFAAHGRFPRGRSELPPAAAEFVARQLQMSVADLGFYGWPGHCSSGAVRNGSNHPRRDVSTGSCVRHRTRMSSCCSPASPPDTPARHVNGWTGGHDDADAQASTATPRTSCAGFGRVDIVDLRPDLRMLVSPPGQVWGLVRDALTRVVLTHWHADHTGAAAEVVQWPDVQVLAHRDDAPVIRGHQDGDEPVFTDAEAALHAQVADGLPDAPPARVDHDLDDGELLPGLGARVIATPGHTRGSVALHLNEAGVLFTGDIAAEHDGQVILGPFNSDREQARRSFRRLAGLHCDVVCFGHGQALIGPATTALHEAATATIVPDPLG